MRKMLGLIIILAIALAVPAFAQVSLEGPETHGGLSPITGANLQQGQSLNSTINPVITNKDIGNVSIGGGFFSSTLSPSASAKVDNDIKNTNIVGQSQFGYVAPKQTVIFKSPTQLLGVNTPGFSELNFGNGAFEEVTKRFPFATKVQEFDASKHKIKKVIKIVANEKFKNFYEEALDVLAYTEKKYAKNISTVAYQAWKADAQKTLQGGFNLSAITSFISNLGTSGGGGGAVTGMQGGNTKAQPLWTIVAVEIELKS